MKREIKVGIFGLRRGASFYKAFFYNNGNIVAVCDRPLVLHGGSGTPDDQMKMAIEHGITKINIYSDVVGAMNAGLKNKLNTIQNPSTWPVFVFEEARKAMREAVRAKIRAFGSFGRV